MSASSAGPITVAIVEDVQELRESIVKYLEREPGLRCTSALASAEEALRRLPQAPPEVVLMDINLGGMSGIECVRRLKDSVPAAQILMLTVYEDDDSIYAALAAGASGNLLKRVAPSKLVEAIREVREGGSPMSASIARRVVQSFQKPAHSECANSLSTREKEVLDGLARGSTYKQIAASLGISIDTIRTYVRRIYEKLHVQSRTAAVAKYLRPG
jgi:DNA-binding NarL/FixJ family response regulator